MIAPLILIGFAVIASALGQHLLSRASWVHTSPHWGIWAWQALTIAVAGAIVLVPVTLAIPLLPISSRLAELLQTTTFHLVEHYNTPGGGWLAVLALLLAFLLVARIGWLAAANVHRAAHRRRKQLDALTLVGRDHPDGFVVVEHDVPFVYCLPGRRRRVVVTSSVLDLLSARELTLVLAHERTHLRVRHDIALALAEALARTFALLPLFRQAHDEIMTLVEMQADDAAQDVADRSALAHALVILTTGNGALTGASVTHTSQVSLARVRRLMSPAVRPMRVRHATALGVATALLISAPLGLAIAPAVEAATQDCCSLSD